MHFKSNEEFLYEMHHWTEMVWNAVMLILFLFREEGRSINGGVLEFTSANFNHGGLYMCAAENFISTIVTVTFVTVQGEFFHSKTTSSNFLIEIREQSLKFASG